MKKLFTALFVTLIFTQCGQDQDCVSAVCIAPPTGAFTPEELNIAIEENVLQQSSEGFEVAFLLDSVLITGSQLKMVRNFYSWIIIDDPESISGFILYSGEEIFAFTKEDVIPDLKDGLRGYVFGFIKNGGDFTIDGYQASEDLINGVCNDTIDC